MAVITKQRQILQASNGGPSAKTSFSDIIAIGTVVSTNDPMQWGRIRAVVPAWGDSHDHKVEGLAWCMYVTPFGGNTSVGTRGAGVQQTEGGIAYGMWAIPKVGAQVVIMSLDEEHQQRLFMGCVFDAFSNNTLPHGRWISEDHPELTNKPKAKPYGPFSAGDKLIQPLASNIQKAFGNTDHALEWQTRASDYAVSRVDVSQLSYATSKVQDDKGTDNGSGWISTQGYQSSRFHPTGRSSTTDKNYDSQVYSLTSPGFHSMSMDDRMENCRMRLRTMSGHQILMDDTNERIYISTAQGNNWVEMDQSGNIDIFSSSRVSIRSASDINLTSDASIRMHAKDGIHLHSDTDTKIFSRTGIHVKSEDKLFVQSNGDANFKVGTVLNISSQGATHVNSGQQLNLTGGKAINVRAGGNILLTGSQILSNGPQAEEAKKAIDAQPALFTNRVPTHEPYARGLTKKDDSHESEYGYYDKKVNRFERGIEIIRGLYWRR